MNHRVAAMAHAVALRAYPRTFRARLGDDLHDTFVARVTQARTRGRLHAALTAVAGCLDTLASGLAERAADRRMRRQRAHLNPPTRTAAMTLESIADDTRLCGHGHRDAGHRHRCQ